MNAQKILAIALIVCGALGLGYGGFSYTSEHHDADVGPIHVSMDEREHANIPLWAGVGAILVGGFLLLGGRKFI